MWPSRTTVDEHMWAILCSYHPDTVAKTSTLNFLIDWDLFHLKNFLECCPQLKTKDPIQTCSQQTPFFSSLHSVPLALDALLLCSRLSSPRTAAILELGVWKPDRFCQVVPESYRLEARLRSTRMGEPECQFIFLVIWKMKMFVNFHFSFLLKIENDSSNPSFKIHFSFFRQKLFLSGGNEQQWCASLWQVQQSWSE